MEAPLNVTSAKNFCDFHEQKCTIYNVIVYGSTNMASIIINVLHLLILRRIPGLKELNYFWVLVNLTFGDIVMSVGVILAVNCELWTLRNCFISVMSLALLTCAFQVRYWLLALAVLDRYYAVCKPFKYTTSKFLKNIGKWSAVAWILNAVLALAEVLTTCSHLCFDGVADSVGKTLEEVSMYSDVAVILVAVVPSMISTVLLVKTAVELRRMKQRSSATAEDKETRSATRYIICVFIMFYVSIIATAVHEGLNLTTKDSSEIDLNWLTSIVLFTQLLYGIGNVILYGALNKAYVTQIKSVCGYLCPVVKVSPQ